MKPFLGSSLIVLILFLTGNSYAHFTGKGHLHTVSETKQLFLNPDCRLTDSCDLKRFSLTTVVYETWFTDDPKYPTYGNGAMIEYETDSVERLERYAVVQFMKGCVFYSSQNNKGKIDRSVSDTATSFGENIPFCFPRWVIDSQDADPAYNSDPEYGRFYLLRWNKETGSHDYRTEKFYGAEKPKLPVVYVADYPAGAFVSESWVKNVALEFRTCLYKASDVPAETRRENIAFAKPIACFEWQNVYVYDFEAGKFRTDLAYAPNWEEPHTLVTAYLLVLLVLLLVALALIGCSHWFLRFAADDHRDSYLSAFRYSRYGSKSVVRQKREDCSVRE